MWSNENNLWYNPEEFEDFYSARKSEEIGKLKTISWAMLYEEVFSLIWTLWLERKPLKEFKKEFFEFIMYYVMARFAVQDLEPISVKKINKHLDALYFSFLTHKEAADLTNEIDVWVDNLPYDKSDLARLSDVDDNIDTIHTILESDPHVVAMSHSHLSSKLTKEFWDHLINNLN